ncbi:MAG: very-short-patch-repair endonuclease [Dokdonia sp.]|jgi:very-short-patch-repair endonuclease
MDHLKNEGMHAGATPDKFAFANQLRSNLTPEEAKLWEYLKTRPFNFKFRRQHPFGDYILDFYCHKAKLVIEVDGKIHDYQKEYDNDRTDIIKEYGITVIRYTNKEVSTRFENIKKDINTILKSIAKR